MKKLLWIGFAVSALAMGGCSSTSDVAKADTKESNKASSSASRSSNCDKSTGSRLAKRC